MSDRTHLGTVRRVHRHALVEHLVRDRQALVHGPTVPALDAARGAAARPGLGRLPVGGAAEAGGLEHLQREQRALHARGGDVDTEQLEHELLVELEQLVDRHALHLVGDHRGRRLRDRAALTAEGDVGDATLVVDLQLDLQLVAAQRVDVLELHVGIVEVPEVLRVLVVLQDLLAIQRVHQEKILRTSARPTMRRSTSARVLCTPIEAREVAGTPMWRISGCAQWWPARMQTPSRARISAVSCGWMPSSVNETAVPRGCSAGPLIVRPSTSWRRSIKYAVTSSSCAGTASMPSESSQRMAAPRPAASTYGVVPASNFQGSEFHVDISQSTRAIISPPPRNGGISSSSSRRPYSTPMPVGP